jgi:hypothetical protein
MMYQAASWAKCPPPGLARTKELSVAFAASRTILRIERVDVHHCVFCVRYAAHCLVQCASWLVAEFGGYPGFGAPTLSPGLDEPGHQLTSKALPLKPAGDADLVDEQGQRLVWMDVADARGHAHDLTLCDGHNEKVRGTRQKGAKEFWLNGVVEDIIVHAVEQRRVGLTDHMYRDSGRAHDVRGSDT